jgi:hypothetical protein
MQVLPIAWSRNRVGDAVVVLEKVKRLELAGYLYERLPGPCVLP